MLDSINCDKLFPSVFLTKDRTLIQAVPQIEIVKIKLSKPEGMGIHIGAMEHVEETDSLLYTTKHFTLTKKLSFWKKQMIFNKRLSLTIANKRSLLTIDNETKKFIETIVFLKLSF